MHTPLQLSAKCEEWPSSSRPIEYDTTKTPRCVENERTVPRCVENKFFGSSLSHDRETTPCVPIRINTSMSLTPMEFAVPSSFLNTDFLQGECTFLNPPAATNGGNGPAQTPSAWRGRGARGDGRGKKEGWARAGWGRGGRKRERGDFCDQL